MLSPVKLAQTDSKRKLAQSATEEGGEERTDAKEEVVEKPKKLTPEKELKQKCELAGLSHFEGDVTRSLYWSYEVEVSHLDKKAYEPAVLNIDLKQKLLRYYLKDKELWNTDFDRISTCVPNTSMGVVNGFTVELEDKSKVEHMATTLGQRDKLLNIIAQIAGQIFEPPPVLIVHNGLTEKRGKRGLNWNPRFMYLLPDRLLICRTDKDFVPLEVLTVLAFKSMRSMESAKTLEMTIGRDDGAGKYYFKFEEESDVDLWLKAFDLVATSLHQAGEQGHYDGDDFTDDEPRPIIRHKTKCCGCL